MPTRSSSDTASTAMAMRACCCPRDPGRQSPLVVAAGLMLRRFGCTRLEPVAEVAVDQLAEAVDFALEVIPDLLLDADRYGLLALSVDPVPPDQALSDGEQLVA